MNEIEKLIETQFKILPPNLQRAIKSMPWKELVQEIGRANTLDAEQIAILEQETMFIIYGFENPDDYISNIIKNVEVLENAADVIAESIVDKIFNPILEKSENYEKEKVPASVPEIAPINLPMIEEGKVAHDVPHTEPTIQTPQPIKTENEKVQVPDYRYDGGKDPYREPLG